MAKRFATSLDRFAVMSVVLFAVVAAVAALTHGGELRRPPLRLADKTLVAWVYLADTAQRGGSDLGTAQTNLHPWRPVWSSLAFMAVMLLAGCVYLHRQDF